MRTPERMLEEIEESAPRAGGKPLTAWEENFCERLRDQLDRGQKLSDEQLSKLREIYDK